MLLKDPHDGCFFCRPEAWRTIFVGQYTQILAGAGPLCPGYCLISPLAHVHAAAELDEKALREFLAIFEILKRVLQNQYRVGYTTYEHGRIGACRTHEVNHDLSTFCHHAHRIVVPVNTDCTSEIEDWFEQSKHLVSPTALQDLAGVEYVYYETGKGDDSVTRVAFTEHKGIPSQFMRRILTIALETGRDWNWVTDLNYLEMIDTVTRLKGEFLGINSIKKEQIENEQPIEVRCKRFN